MNKQLRKKISCMEKNLLTDVPKDAKELFLNFLTSKNIRNVLETQNDKDKITQFNANLLKKNFENNDKKINDLINDIYDINNLRGYSRSDFLDIIKNCFSIDYDNTYNMLK